MLKEELSKFLEMSRVIKHVEVAKLLGVENTAYCNWRCYGYFPDEVKKRMAELLCDDEFNQMYLRRSIITDDENRNVERILGQSTYKEIAVVWGIPFQNVYSKIYRVGGHRGVTRSEYEKLLEFDKKRQAKELKRQMQEKKEAERPKLFKTEFRAHSTFKGEVVARNVEEARKLFMEGKGNIEWVSEPMGGKSRFKTTYEVKGE